jgi:2',3'-cyclic-nucleotide 2'-phosphodiesterase/3'-nucleotidase
MKHVLKIIGTGDVHGACFPYDFVNRLPVPGSLSAVASKVAKIRHRYKENLIVVDCGDLLQGQPVPYYYNFVDTDAPHLLADIYNDIGYDAMTIGNHDIETGHDVYDRWRSQCKFPILAANAIDVKTGEPYFRPYTTLVRSGIKIAILGLTSPCIPYWLPRPLWEGIRFENMLTSARKWMEIIREKEKPHLVIGLFHSGKEGGINDGTLLENATLQVATEVPGFHIVIYGHDHMRRCERIINKVGKEVVCLNPSDKARCVAEAHVELWTRNTPEADDGVEVSRMNILARIADMTDTIDPEDRFGIKYQKAFHDVDTFVMKQVGTLLRPMRSRDAFFGPSTYIDFIHTLQLEISHADVSFAAPLSFDDTLHEGPLYAGGLFKLYRYENPLYTLRMTGQEIKDYLEMSYDLWTQQMQSAQDHLIRFTEESLLSARPTLANLFYNYDSAAGIRYTVDLTKPCGEKIQILSMGDGTPFSPTREYVVVTSSYRSNGGGELMTKGAGIPHEELAHRMIGSTEKDMRHYLLKYIREKGEILPECRNEWKFIPEEWAQAAIEKDRELLFPG